MFFRLFIVVCIGLGVCIGAGAAETDQYMTWELELADCGPAFNVYLNEEAVNFLERINERKKKVRDAYTLSQEFYLYLFQGLHNSRVRRWFWEEESVERYPENEVSFFQYQKMSIYEGPAFPFILPMARTVRIGDVYLGVDKIGHFFGFGRRYAVRYHDLTSSGVGHDEAIERMIKVGVSVEGSLVGGLTDGIYAYGDLEANYQGFLMSRDLTEGENPVFVMNDAGMWEQRRKIDILPYITPDFDESWNPCHFTRLRKKHVLPLLQERYCDKRDGEIIKARFEKYATYPKSLLMTEVTRIKEERAGEGKQTMQARQALDCLCDPDCSPKPLPAN